VTLTATRRPRSAARPSGILDAAAPRAGHRGRASSGQVVAGRRGAVAPHRPRWRQAGCAVPGERSWPSEKAARAGASARGEAARHRWFPYRTSPAGGRGPSAATTD